MPSTRLTAWGGLTVLVSLLSFADIGYTPDELRALSRLEQQIQQQPLSLQTQQAIQTQQQTSTQFIEHARQQARHWQEKLDPSALQGIVDIPTPTENPNAAPTGVMVFVSLTRLRSRNQARLYLLCHIHRRLLKFNDHLPVVFRTK